VLARLAFGAWLAVHDVRTVAETGPGAGRPGITGVSAGDIEAARASGQVIKLVAEARRAREAANGQEFEASVVPTLVDAESELGRTSGVLNRIEVAATPVGIVAFSGPGAGGPATSSAVLGDLVAIARGLGSTWAGLPPATRVAATVAH
jgi:homoserine dehydrogenase